MVRVATSLGIDTKRYILRVKNSDANGEILQLNQTFLTKRDLELQVIWCCTVNVEVHSDLGNHGSRNIQSHIQWCLLHKVQLYISTIKLTSQLESMIRKHIALYYAGWLVCDDLPVEITTRQISVYGKRCIGNSGRAMDYKGL